MSWSFIIEFNKQLVMEFEEEGFADWRHNNTIIYPISTFEGPGDFGEFQLISLLGFM